MNLIKNKECPICGAEWPKHAVLLEYTDRTPCDMWHELQCQSCKSKWDRGTEKLIFCNYAGSKFGKTIKK